MSLFAYFEKFNIPTDQIQSLTDEDIIRIEKRLKAEARLNDEIDQNEIENVLKLLKNSKEQLSIIFSGELDLLKAVLTNPEKFLFTRNQMLVQGDMDTEKMTHFLQEHFQDVLLKYVDNCVKKEYYNALHTLLKYHEILPVGVVDYIQKKLENKLNFAIECIRIKTQGREQKIGYVTNPFFFRSLSLIGASHFDKEIRALLNTAIEQYGEEQFNLMLFFSMDGYKSQNESMSNTLQNNANFARRRGVEEVLENPFTRRKTGGTQVKGRTQTARSTVSRTTQRQSPIQKSKNKSKGLIIFLVVLVAVIVANAILRNAPDAYDFSDTGWSYSTSENEYGNPPGYEDTRDLPVYFPQDPSLESVINYLNEPETEIISATDIPFETAETQLNKFDEFKGGMKNVKVLNETGKRALVMIKTAYWEQYELVEPDSSFMTKSIANGFKVYMGDKPQMVDYIDVWGDQQSHFWFAESGAEELEQLNEYFSTEHSFGRDRAYTLHITCDTGAIDFYVDASELEPVFVEDEPEAEVQTETYQYPFPDYNDSEHDFIATMDYLHQENTPIIETRRIEYSTAEAGFVEEGYSVAFDKKSVLIENSTGKPMLIMVNTKGGERIFALLDTYNKFNVPHDAINYQVFFGTNPMVATYIDESGDTLQHFRFGSFEPSDWERFRHPIPFSEPFYSGKQYVVQITYKAYDDELGDFTVYF